MTTAARNYDMSYLARLFLAAGLVLALVGGISVLVENYAGPESLESWTAIVPLVIIGTGLGTAALTFRRNPNTLWTPLPWFALACAAYFGFGAAAFSFAHPATVEYIQSTQQTSIPELARSNRVNLVGIAVIAITIAFILWRASRKAAQTGQDLAALAAQKDIGTENARRLGLMFLIPGLFFKFFLVLPHEFGALNFTLPGVLFQLEDLVSIGLLLLAIVAAREGGKWRAVVGSVAFMVILSDTARFNKTAILLNVIMVTLGWYKGSGRIRHLLTGMLFGLSFYVVLAPRITQGREVVALIETASGHVMGVGDRIGLLQTYREEITTVEEDPGNSVQRWWARLAYTDRESFAIQQQDGGIDGVSFNDIPIVFIPRMFWKNKPVISAIGNEFNVMFGGDERTSSSPTVIGEAYWNWAWYGVLIIGIIVGLILASVSRVSLWVIANERFLLMPCVLLGIRMGMRIDGWFVIDYQGMMLNFGAAFVALTVFGKAARHIGIKGL